VTAAGIDDRVRELERQYVDRQVALTNVLRIIGESTADLRTTLGEVLESALQLCQADFGTIYLPDEGGYRIAASAGPGKDEIYAYERDHADRPGRHSVTGRVLLSRGPVLIADVLADPEYDQPDAQRISRFRSLLGVPIEREGEIIGVFNLGRYEVRPYTDAEIALVSLYAEQAGVAIENARFIATIERQRREYLDRQTALNEILRIIGGSGFALGSVLDTVVESAARLANAEFANVYLDDGTGTYRIATSLMGPDEFAYEREHPPTASDESVAGRVILTGGVVHVEDITTDDSYTYATGLSDQRTFAAIEELVEAEPIGELQIKGLTRPVAAYDVHAVRDPSMPAA
jgi:putative methionine-R-sulfoxide reductase with GAF domain